MKPHYKLFTKALGISIVVITQLLTLPVLKAQDWYNVDWEFRREISIANPGSTELTDFQVLITLDGSFDFSDTELDGSDIRITTDDGTSLIYYWMETWEPATPLAEIWVKVPSIPIGGTTIILYYGNPAANLDLVETSPAGPYTKSPSNPIIPIGDPLNGQLLLAENMVYDDVTGHWWMIFSSYRGSGQQGMGLVWSDTPSDPTSWNWHGNVISHFYYGSFAPHLMIEDGLWYIFYADFPDIVYVTSPDVTGPYSASTSVLSPSEPWEIARVDEPCVFKRNDGVWMLVYMGDSGGNVEQVGYATSNNLTGPYTKYAGNPCLPFGPPGLYDAGTIADPWVYEYYGTYYIGYAVSPTVYSPWQTALATTTDWITFDRHGILLPLGDEFNAHRGDIARINNEYVFSYTSRLTPGGNYYMAIATQPVYVPHSDVLNSAEDVFDFYDDFDGIEINLLEWDINDGDADQINVENGLLTLTATSIYDYIEIFTKQNFGMNYISETSGAHVQQGVIYKNVELGFNDVLENVVRITEDDQIISNYWQREANLTGQPSAEVDMAQIADPNWHTFSVYRESPDLAGFQIDNTPVETSATDVPTSDLSHHLLSYGLDNELVVDWTRVRKWSGDDITPTIGYEQKQVIIIDVAVSNTTCGDFEVKLRSSAHITDNFFTNIQFTLKWPENTVNLDNFYSDFGINQQGSVVVDNGYNYAVFVSSANVPINWVAGNEYTIFEFSHDQSTTGYADFEIAEDTWTTTNNGEYYVELLGLDKTGILYGNASNVYLGKCGEIKALLQGTYSNGGIMNTDLVGNIPLSQPYNVAPWNYSGSESLAEIDAAVVDWVLVELRSDETSTVEKKAALLLSNGQIVQYDNMTQGVHFDNATEGSSFYIVVYHRNHMPVMTAGLEVFDGTLVDFTDETICYGTPNAEIELETGIYGLIAGDINSNGLLSYSGPGNDRGLVLSRIVNEENTTNINDVTLGYFDEDVLMDYEVKYIGSGNDRAVILTNLADLTGSSYLNAAYLSLVPGVALKSEISNSGPIQIFLNETENELQVKIYSNELISEGIVDNIQFTITWESSSNDIVLPVLDEIQSQFGLTPQGEAIIYNGKMYQTFASVMLVTLPSYYYKFDQMTLASFQKGRAVELKSIMKIADDDFSSSKNGSYFISVLGENKTGSVQSDAPAVNDDDDMVNDLSFYPNPVTSGILNMEMNIENDQEVTVRIMTAHGKIMSTQIVKVDKGLTNNQIDLQKLPKGIYYILVKVENGNIVRKLVRL